MKLRIRAGQHELHEGDSVTVDPNGPDPKYSEEAEDGLIGQIVEISRNRARVQWNELTISGNPTQGLGLVGIYPLSALIPVRTSDEQLKDIFWLKELGIKAKKKK